MDKFIIMETNKYIVWGIGWEAEQFYYQYHDRIDILYFVDNFNHGRKFYKLEVKKPELATLKRGKILVATSEYYEQIKKQLYEMGFIEHRDFEYCFNVNKKIVFINGNCHCDIIKQYLKTSQKFSQQYAFGDWPFIFQNKDYDEKILEYCDLFIHQDIRENNSVGYKYSDEYILPRLRKDCIQCCIPNLYGFPKAMFYKNNKISDENCEHVKVYNPFLYREEIIDDGIEHRDSFQNIVEKLKGEFVDSDEVIFQFEKDKEALLKREERWDVKISDFIYKKYQKTQLFYDVGHPTNTLLKEISNRILTYLGIDNTDLVEIDTNVGCYEVPIYECIRKALNIEWADTYFRKKSSSASRFVLGGTLEMDLEEYIKEYIWWYYGKNDKNSR